MKGNASSSDRARERRIQPHRCPSKEESHRNGHLTWRRLHDEMELGVVMALRARWRVAAEAAQRPDRARARSASRWRQSGIEWNRRFFLSLIFGQNRDFIMLDSLDSNYIFLIIKKIILQQRYFKSSLSADFRVVLVCTGAA